MRPETSKDFDTAIDQIRRLIGPRLIGLCELYNIDFEGERLVLDNVRFQKPVNFKWNQLNGMLNTTEEGAWEL